MEYVISSKEIEKCVGDWVEGGRVYKGSEGGIPPVPHSPMGENESEREKESYTERLRCRV